MLRPPSIPEMKLSIVLTLALLLSFIHPARSADEKPKQNAPAKATYEGGDGSSFEKAVLIKGANEQTGVHAEYEWLAKRHPGYKRGKQSLKRNSGRMFDVLSITTKDGKELDVYFDITEFFGKF